MKKFFFISPLFSIVPKLKCLLRTPDLKRQFTWFLPLIGSSAQTSLLYFSYDAFYLRRNIYHSYIRKEKWVPMVPGSFSDNFLFKEGWKWPRCLRTRLFLPLWGIIFMLHKRSITMRFVLNFLLEGEIKLNCLLNKESLRCSTVLGWWKYIGNTGPAGNFESTKWAKHFFAISAEFWQFCDFVLRMSRFKGHSTLCMIAKLKEINF